MGMSALAMVDVGLDRYGRPQNDAVARAEFLRWLNAAQKLLWAADDWPFKKVARNLTLTNGVDRIVLDAAVEAVLFVKDKNGLPLTWVEPRTFRTVYRTDPSTGAPLRYTVDERVVTAAAGGQPDKIQLALYVWPTPNAAAAGTGTVGTQEVLADLSDESTCESQIPDEERGTLLAWALELMAAQQKNEMAQVYAGERTGGLEAMRHRYGLRAVRKG
jgi:hypothetical protein